MRLRICLVTAFVLFAPIGALQTASAFKSRSSQADVSAQDDALRALNGEWLYVEDRTEGRPVEEQGPPMGPKFGLRVEEGAVVLVRSDREIRIALDGTATEVDWGGGSISRYTGEWKDGVFKYQSVSAKSTDPASARPLTIEMRPTPEGLLVRVMLGSNDQLALFRHPEEIALPTPAKAAVSDLAWLAGAWVGTRGTSSIEERWTPPLGGAMLGVSRTVNKSGKMSAFEYLRIVEREGGLVYVAQPGGRKATEFVLTELTAARAVFENPRHDRPQRIVYELSPDGVLSASIGFMKGGSPQRFEFKREGH